MRNPWGEFQGLLPAAPLYVAKVISVSVAGGSSVVELPGGSTKRFEVRGISVAAGAYAFVRDGEIRGPAPAVVPVDLEV